MARAAVSGYVSGAPLVKKKVETFKASGTFTPPAGVTYAVAYMTGGGGGSAISAPGTGGTSSVAFAGGTVTALGGIGHIPSGLAAPSGVAGTDNSGKGARSEYVWASAAYTQWGSANAQDGAVVVAGNTVTPGTGITVTVGAGGTGTITGGSGLVVIEYEGY
jgi:hypothetical protein